MAVDLTTVPWNRLAKLSPPGTNADDLQAAADRWATNADVYNAAADLWEDLLFTVDVAPDETPEPDARLVNRVTQDGITVEYASDPLAGNNQSTRVAQAAQIRQRVRQLRARGKPTSPLVHTTDYDPWTGAHEGDEPEIIIDVYE
jgi:hypothetical protein